MRTRAVPEIRMRRPPRPPSALERAGQERWIEPPRRKTRVKVTFLEGRLARRTLLFDRPVPERWSPNDGLDTYDLVDVGHARYAVLAAPEETSTPTLAWRGWNLVQTSAGWRLQSMTNDTAWPVGGPLVATCDYREHTAACRAEPRDPGHQLDEKRCDCPKTHERAPDASCACGIYCTKTLGDLADAGHEYDRAIGLLAGWGRWIEHDYGYRFERVYPQAIVVAPSAGWLAGQHRNTADPSDLLRLIVADLRRAYRVPVGSCSPNVALEKMVGLVARAGLPNWTRRALPPDIRVAAAIMDAWKETSNGSEGR